MGMTLLEAAQAMMKDMDLGKLEKQMFVNRDAPVFNQKDGLTLSRVIEYMNADREQMYKCVCAHCRAKVPYSENDRRHIRAGKKIACHAQRLRDRETPDSFLTSLNQQQWWLKKLVPTKPWDGGKFQSVSSHALEMARLSREKYGKPEMYRLAYGGADRYDPEAMSSNVDPQACDACKGSGKFNGEECWHCEGEGVDPTK